MVNRLGQAAKAFTFGTGDPGSSPSTVRFFLSVFLKGGLHKNCQIIFNFLTSPGGSVVKASHQERPL